MMDDGSQGTPYMASRFVQSQPPSAALPIQAVGYLYLCVLWSSQLLLNFNSGPHFRSALSCSMSQLLL